MLSKRRLPEGELAGLVRRLLESNEPAADIPVIVSTTQGEYRSSVGRLLEHSGARVTALVDCRLEPERPVTIFLPENAYLGEVVRCVPQRDYFMVELVLIQYRDDEADAVVSTEN